MAASASIEYTFRFLGGWRKFSGFFFLRALDGVDGRGLIVWGWLMKYGEVSEHNTYPYI